MPQRKNPHEYYAVLGLRPGASAAELRRTWIKLVKQWHPDRFARNPRLQVFAQEKLKEINEAYTFLRDYNPATGTSRYDTWQPSESYAGAQSARAGQSRTGYQARTARTYRYRPAPGPSPYEGDYQYRPVGANSPSRFAWVLAAIFAANVFSGIFRPYSASPAPAPSNATEVKLDVNPPESRTSVAAPQSPYFTRGSSKADVYRIQGVPSYSTKIEWRYGSSRVYFAGDTVVGWESRADSPLMAKEASALTGHFGIGSSMLEVLAAQGTPTYVGDNNWKYGESSVQFSDGKVIGWQERPGSPLRVHSRLAKK